MYALCYLYKTDWSEFCISVDGVFTTESLAKSNASPNYLQVILPVKIDKLFNFKEFVKKHDADWFEKSIRSLVKKKILLEPKLKIDQEIKRIKTNEKEVFKEYTLRDDAYWHYALGCPEILWLNPGTKSFISLIKSGEYLKNREYQEWYKELY